MTRLALILAFITSPVLADGINWSNEPEPEPPPPPPTITVTTPNDDSDPLPRSEQIAYARCTCTGMTVAWGFEAFDVREANARRQCAERRVRLACEVSDDAYAPGVLK